MSEIIPLEQIENKILLIRGKKVLLDSGLAKLYGVTTKRLNEQVGEEDGVDTCPVYLSAAGLDIEID